MGRGENNQNEHEFGDVDSTPMEDFEEFGTWAEAVTADVAETARKGGLEVEPEDGTELLQPGGQTWRDEELFLMDEQRKGVLEMESAPGKDEMAAKI